MRTSVIMITIDEKDRSTCEGYYSKVTSLLDDEAPRHEETIVGQELMTADNAPPTASRRVT
eukprot:9208234-Heterocapsa_arctica.AAC.1